MSLLANVLTNRLKPHFPPKTEACLLSNNIHDYRIVSQGKTTIPSVDDSEEFHLTEVRHRNSII